jgi:4-hydroxy-3-polyprenylbenzoate decarboxylase
MSTERKNIIVGMTGASGMPYARMLLETLHDIEGIQVFLIASAAAKLVYKIEIGTSLEAGIPSGVKIFDEKDFTAPFASGSFPSEGMVIVPCTMGTLGAIAGGLSLNLIHRAADVCLKERRKLVLVPRETPLNRIHLQNMLGVHDAGGTILPAMPGFYHKPGSVDDIARFIVARILEQLGLPQDLMQPWSPPPPVYEV